MPDALAADGCGRDRARHAGGRLLGQRLGELVDTVLRAVPLRRLVLSGGDTLSRIMQRLAPDAPLCGVSSRQPHLRALQIALKGGQMGQANYFDAALHGRGASTA